MSLEGLIPSKKVVGSIGFIKYGEVGQKENPNPMGFSTGFSLPFTKPCFFWYPVFLTHRLIGCLLASLFYFGFYRPFIHGFYRKLIGCL